MAPLNCGTLGNCSACTITKTLPEEEAAKYDSYRTVLFLPTNFRETRINHNISQGSFRPVVVWPRTRRTKPITGGQQDGQVKHSNNRNSEFSRVASVAWLSPSVGRWAAGMVHWTHQQGGSGARADASGQHPRPSQSRSSVH